MKKKKRKLNKIRKEDSWFTNFKQRFPTGVLCYVLKPNSTIPDDIVVIVNYDASEDKFVAFNGKKYNFVIPVELVEAPATIVNNEFVYFQPDDNLDMVDTSIEN